MNDLEDALVDRLRLGIPDELQRLKQWLVWREEREPGEDDLKPRKVPYYITGHRRSGVQGTPQDQMRWASFDDAVAVVARGDYAGVGLAMSGNANIVGVDLDHCVDDDDQISTLAKEILNTVDTYAELSPSGRGLHVFYRGSCPNAKAPGLVELFHSTGFLTFTGNRITGGDLAPMPISLRTRLLELTRGSTATGSQPRHERLEQVRSQDPVIARLTERGLAKRHRHDGGVDITCPFASEHTTGGGGGDTTYWPANTGGFLRGHFKCLHSHCSNRDDEEFLTSIGMQAPATRITPTSSAASKEPTQITPAPVEWSEPQNILREFSAPPYDAHDLPASLGNYAIVFARAAGFDSTATVVPAAAAAAAMIDDGVRIMLPGHTGFFESPRLWVLPVGPPGSGKTPCVKKMTAPIVAAHRKAVETWTQDTKDLPEAERAAMSMPAMFTGDCTIEKLCDLLAANERGLLFLNDELESWMGGHDAYRQASASRDRGEWARLFEGGPHQVDRVRRGSHFIPNFGVSLISATTPDTLRKLGRHLPNDGLLQRFIIGCVGRRPKPDPISYPEMALLEQGYADTLDRLRRIQPGVVRLSDAASDLFQTEAAQLQRLVEAVQDTSPPFASHLNKHAALLGRVALIFHCAATPEPIEDPVSDTTMRCAINFMRKARVHAMTLYADAIQASPAITLARDIARWLLAKSLGRIEKRELVASVRSFRKAEYPEQIGATSFLCDAGWLTREETGYQKGGPTRWSVNPKVHEMFRKEALAERERRAVMRELLAEAVAERQKDSEAS